MGDGAGRGENQLRQAQDAIMRRQYPAEMGGDEGEDAFQGMNAEERDQAILKFD